MALAESPAPEPPAPESLGRAQPARTAPPRPTFRQERKLFREGFIRVAGVDEAGRGPLAGPVVAAAVVLDPKRIPRGIADSKLLLPQEREAIFAKLCKSAEISFAFGCVTAIDRINILQATLVAMRRAVAALARPADAVLIDGNVLPKGLSCEARAIVGGDATCLSVAAASIVAKVIRDRLMRRCDAVFAGYGLASHKGYSTKEHQAALAALGPSRLHRSSFWRVAAAYEQAELPLVPLEDGELAALAGFCSE
jgi:ribonuclease HII